MMGNFDHCLAYLDKLPPALSGSGGHNATFRAACECVRFGLTDAEALAALQRYNARCSPPWSERELRHKLDSARRKATPGEKAGSRYGKPPIKARTAAQLAERTARRKVQHPAPTLLAGTPTNGPSCPNVVVGNDDGRWTTDDGPLIPSCPNVVVGYPDGFPPKICRNDGLIAPMGDRPPSVVCRPSSPLIRWQGDFLDFMQAYQPGPRPSIELVALWQSYHAWCAQNDFAPMTAADFCEWLLTTYSITRDEVRRIWVHTKDRIWVHTKDRVLSLSKDHQSARDKFFL